LSFTHLECATLYNLTFLHRRFNINSPRWRPRFAWHELLSTSVSRSTKCNSSTPKWLVWPKSGTRTISHCLPLPTALLLILLFAILFFFLCCLSRVSELENKIAAQCLQLHGGAGYLYDTPIARAYLDVRVQTIYGGSNEVLKDLIARQILAPAKKI
jgi:hypothetical protein